jgi:hypothetical protein
MGWQVLGFLYGFLHEIIGVGFGVLQVACAMVGRILLRIGVQFLCKLLQFTI